MNLESQTAKTVKNLERYERNWQFFKATLYTVLAVAIIVVNFYTYHRLFQNSDKNRQLLRCTVFELTSPDESPQTFRVNLQTCLDKTR